MVWEKGLSCKDESVTTVDIHLSIKGMIDLGREEVVTKRPALCVIYIGASGATAPCTGRQGICDVADYAKGQGRDGER